MWACGRGHECVCDSHHAAQAGGAESSRPRAGREKEGVGVVDPRADHETTDTGLRWEEEQHLLSTRCAAAVSRGFRHVSLTFSETDLHAPHLQVIFQQCRSVDDDTAAADDGAEVWAFPRERVPSHEHLVEWAESQIRYERDNGLGIGFQSSVEAFVMMYTKAGSTLPQVRIPHPTAPSFIRRPPSLPPLLFCSPSHHPWLRQ